MHRNTVLNWARAGWLPHTVTQGGHYRFDPEVVQATVRAAKTKRSLSDAGRPAA